MTKRITYHIDGDPAVVLNGEVEDVVAAALADRIEEAIKPPSLEKQIIRWAEEKGLTGPNNGPRQFLKVLEAFGELAGGMARGDKELIKGALGNLWVTVIVLRAIYGDQNSFSPSPGPPVRSLAMLRMLDSLKTMGNAVDSRNPSFAATVSKELIDLGCHIAAENSLDLRNCLQQAWDRIKEGE